MKGVLLLAVAVIACRAAPAADREVRLARLAAERRQLMDRLEDLQARLIVDRQRVRFWEEMQERHQSISAIACTSQEAHAVAMAEHLLPRQKAKPELGSGGSRVRARVAAVRATPDRPAPRSR